MGRALLWRLGRGVLVLVGISVLVFLIFFATPGADPAARLAGRGASPEVVARVRAEYGLDRGMVGQYAGLMRRLFVTRDLPSFVNRGQLVVPAMLRAAPVTLGLAAGAVVLWVAAGLGIGLVAAAWRGGWVDRAVVMGGLLGVSIPAFWLAEVVVAASQGEGRWAAFGWVPPLGLAPAGMGGWVASMALPWATLAMLYAGIYGRVMRTGLAAGLDADYARTARAKGLSEGVVALRHVLPNAAVPALALLGLDVGALLGGGTVLVEMVFGLHGIGRLTYDALHSLDLAMVMACVLYGSVLVVGANTLAEVAQAVLDPRVRE